MVEVTDQRKKRIAEFIEPLRVRPGAAVDLAKDFDPGYRSDFLKKKDGVELLDTGIALLADYQGGSPRRTPTACSCACRRWTRAARTGRSGTS